MALAVNNGYREYMDLYKASVQGNWKEAEKFLDRNQHIMNAAAALVQIRLNRDLETPLHVAARAGHASFIEKLVAELPNDHEALFLKTTDGLTPLHFAAWHGNTEVARILVAKNHHLLYLTNNEDRFPIHYAARNSRSSKDAYHYFSRLMMAHPCLDPYQDRSGATIVNNLIELKFYDEAKKLVRKFPDLIRHRALYSGNRPLDAILAYDYPVINKASLSFWQTLIYHCIFKSSTCRQFFHGCSQLLPRKSTLNKMLMNQKVVELLKCLCKDLVKLSDDDMYTIAPDVILRAAQLDIDEVILNIVENYPSMALCEDRAKKNILFVAVENRCENVFNLVRRNSVLMNILLDKTDKNRNSILHLAGKLAPPHKLNLVSGAALQMQRELQWFKEVERIARPYFSSMRNKKGKTPSMVFTEEHNNLKTEGEKWMKDTANSCTIVAALIVTVVFAAAITIPGSNSGEDGLPIFSKRKAFTIFAISNAASLFTSATSLLVFLSILTSRYAEQDFVYALPRRLIIGLFTLFLSIIFMMTAFSSTVYLVFGRKQSWVVITVAALACLPVTSFVLLQFPLLLTLVSSTYGHGIFNTRAIPQMLF